MRGTRTAPTGGAINVFILMAMEYIGLLRNPENQEGDQGLQPSWLD
jgi:hypothetical protein